MLITPKTPFWCASFMASQGYFRDQCHGPPRSLAGCSETGRVPVRALWRAGPGCEEGVSRASGQRHEPRAAVCFAGTPPSVSLARFISFVRTLMPWFAGMTKLSYSRFLLYDVSRCIRLGGRSVLIGYVPVESWEVPRARSAEPASLSLASSCGWCCALPAKSARAGESAGADCCRSEVRVALTGTSPAANPRCSTSAKVGARRDRLPTCSRAVPSHRARTATRRWVSSFGEQILAADGSIESGRTARNVFADSGERTRLEAIVNRKSRACAEGRRSPERARRDIIGMTYRCCSRRAGQRIRMPSSRARG